MTNRKGRKSQRTLIVRTGPRMHTTNLEHELLLFKAYEHYRDNESSLVEVAKKFGIHRNSLSTYFYKDSKTRVEAQSSRMSLTLSEEDILSSYITKHSMKGSLFTISNIQNLASNIIRERLSSGDISKSSTENLVSRGWVTGFIKRYPLLQKYNLCPMDAKQKEKINRLLEERDKALHLFIEKNKEYEDAVKLLKRQNQANDGTEGSAGKRKRGRTKGSGSSGKRKENENKNCSANQQLEPLNETSAVN